MGNTFESRKTLSQKHTRKWRLIPSVQRIILVIVRDALLGGGVVDESPMYALLTNSRYLIFMLEIVTYPGRSV